MPVVGVSLGPGGEERGVVGTLQVTVAYPGKGEIYVASEPLTEVDTQGVARVAVLVASALAHKDWTKYDFFFKFRTPSVIVGGPSAGLAMTVAAYSALTGTPLREDVAGTGTVGPDGVVGPVGGVYAKMVAAAKSGYKVFVVPKGEEVVTRKVVETEPLPFGIVQRLRTEKVNLIEEGKRLGVEVVPAATAYDALRVWLKGAELPECKPDVRLPGDVLRLMREWKEHYLKLYEGARSEARRLTQESVALLSEAERMARAAGEEKDPYEAVNYAFTAAILAEEAKWYDEVALSGFRALVKLSDEVESKINEANATIMNSLTYDVNKLDPLLTAATRVLKAYYFYHAALNSTDLGNIIYYLVLAKYYSEAAKTWIALTSLEPPGPKADPEALWRDALALYSSAGELFAYYTTIGSQVGAVPSRELEVAVGVYKEANDMPAIYKLAASTYLSALVTYSLHTTYNISSETMIDKVMAALSCNAALALDRGLKPYAAEIYYTSARASEGEAAFLYAALASTHFLLLSLLA